MASPARRRMLALSGGGGGSGVDNGPADITSPQYFLRADLGARTARILSGRGTFSPGYTIRGTQADALSENLTNVRVLKMVSPLTGQGPADPRATGFFYGMDFGILQPRIYRQRKTVAPNTGYTVVVRPRTAIRRMDSRGQGTVGYV